MASIKYHFFGKDCVIDRSLRDQKAFQDKIKDLGFDFALKPHFINQIHGSEVMVIDDLVKIYDENALLPKADALVTNIKKLPICVITADCVPIIFSDETNNVVGVAHAGWRGAKAQVIENTIAQMLKIGAKIDQIKAIIGPCIRQESYEVSGEFYQDFLAENKANEAFFVPSIKESHFMFDLPSYCISRLKKAGIKQIEDQKIDTYSCEKTLFSYRRATHQKIEDCGRNISIIMIN